MPRARLLLIGLVTFACDEHHVAELRLADRHRDCVCTVELHRVAPVAGVADAVHDLARNRLRPLAARVVAGDHYSIGKARRDASHFRALAAVPFATAAEYPNQITANGYRRPQR